jgi:hypothetical protein
MDVLTDPGPQTYERTSEANHQGFADAANGEPLFPDADQEYAAGWWSYHRQRDALSQFFNSI